MTITHIDGTVPVPEESHFTCSAEVARQLISNLANASEMQDGGANPFYVFSAEKRHVRVTILPIDHPRGISVTVKPLAR